MSEAYDAGAEGAALLTLLRTQEEKLLAADQRASHEAVAELLADDFVEFARSGGIYDRDQTIAALAGEGPAYDRKAFDFKLSLLGEGVALLTYRSTRQSAADREEQCTLRSSIWMRVGGRWRMRFHQGTPIR
ncbi:MAG TPA: nuclear transport factor 2 family protein [Bosea sp. (in: a-proteobacteria)]